MLKVMQGLPQGIVGIEGSGRITKDDYINVLEPILEKASKNDKKISILFYLNETYEGYTPGAVFEDTAMGLKYFNVIKKCAVVTDSSLITGAVKLFAPILPIEFKAYRISQLSEAKVWLTEIPDTDIEFHFDKDDNILAIIPSHSLRLKDFQTLQNLLNQIYRDTDIISGVILKAQHFPGWEDLRSLLAHFEFLKDNRQHLEKVAICTDNRLIRNALPTVIKNLEDIDAKVFKYEKIDDARNWLRNIEIQDKLRAV